MEQCRAVVDLLLSPHWRRHTKQRRQNGASREHQKLYELMSIEHACSSFLTVHVARTHRIGEHRECRGEMCPENGSQNGRDRPERLSAGQQISEEFCGQHSSY